MAQDLDGVAMARAATVSDGKRYQLWGTALSEAQRKSMLLDDVAIYSVTDARTADRITKLVLKLSPPVRRVVDGCACVGGNVLSFARAFGKVAGGAVAGVELDATRCSFLRHNVSEAGVAADVYEGDVAAATEFGADVTPLSRTLEDADLLFLDPPWGGPEVSAKPAGTVRLSMSGVDVAVLVKRFANQNFRAKFVLLKLPPNYDLGSLERGLADVASVKVETAFRKMILAVVTLKGKGGAPPDDAAPPPPPAKAPPPPAQPAGAAAAP